jgi:hypothetical protein
VTANLLASSHIGGKMWCVEISRKYWLALRFVSSMTKLRVLFEKFIVAQPVTKFSVLLKPGRM